MDKHLFMEKLRHSFVPYTQEEGLSGSLKARFGAMELMRIRLTMRPLRMAVSVLVIGEYAEILSGLGILGFIAYFFPYFKMGASAIQRGKTSESKELKVLLLTLIA